MTDNSTTAIESAPSSGGLSNRSCLNSDSRSVEISDAGNALLADSAGDNDYMATWNTKLLTLQKHANILSHLLTILAIIFVSLWISELGGVSWATGNAKVVFNWHPLLMITAFCFMTVASLSFRFPYYKACWTNRNVTKLLHGSSWFIAMMCALIALVAVFKSHNDPVSGLIANLYSLHSWIGLSVITLYILQFLLGVFAFGNLFGTSSIFTPSVKAKVMTFHKYFGPFIYQLTAATILLGIQEKEGFIGCSYKVNEPDLFPPAHLMEIPSACRISHTLGIIILFLALCTSFALHDFTPTSSNAVAPRTS